MTAENWRKANPSKEGDTLNKAVHYGVLRGTPRNMQGTVAVAVRYGTYLTSPCMSLITHVISNICAAEL